MSRFASRSNLAQTAQPDTQRSAAWMRTSCRGRFECASLVKAALERLQEGDVSRALELLSHLLTSIQRPGNSRDGAWAARVLSRRLVRPRADKLGRSVDEITLLASAAHEPAPSSPIRIRALGSFDLSIDGVTFANGVKPQRRPLDLLKILVVSNGQSVGAAELADRLWPDSDGDTARNSLQVAVHRLRRLLGRDQAVIVQDRKICLDHALCAVDLWTFEHDAQQLTHQYGVGPSFSERAAETLRLYRGHLFAHEPEQPWMLAPRERLRRLWLSLVRQLGDCYEARGEQDRACELYQRAVDLDPLAEEVYRRLMRCQQRAGEAVEAMHTYQCCREQLGTVLGVAPSPETERLYNTLRSAA